MAEKRMFSKSVVQSDAFIEMPLSTQALYLHLSMEADDDGFVSAPKKISRMIGASEDDLKILLAKRFILLFDSGVVVIKHWKINNYIPKDRYKPTLYQEEYKMLKVKDNNAYTENVYKSDTDCIQDVYKLDTQSSIDKNSIDKNRLDKRSSSIETTTTTSHNVFEYYQKNQIQPDINENIANQIECYAEEMDEGCIIHAFEQAYESNKRNWAYVKAILNRYKSENFKTVADVIAAEDRRKSAITPSSEDLKNEYEKARANLYAKFGGSNQ